MSFHRDIIIVCIFETGQSIPQAENNKAIIRVAPYLQVVFEKMKFWGVVAMSSASDKTWELTLTIAISAFVLLSILVFTFPNALAAKLTLAWDANTESDLAGYRLYYGTSTRNYPNNFDIGNVTPHTVPNLVDGQTY